jgi:lincosamide nucleotidyltransferase A/C/D/E
MATKPEMTPAALVELLQACEGAGIPVWLDGGWGVDALLQTQTRIHKDVDLILPVADVPKLQDLLAVRGFAVRDGTPPHSFVLADGTGLEVDVHAVTFDGAGNGVYRMQNGVDWVYPAEGFGGRGLVGPMPVRCLSPTVQVLCHAHGYVPAEKDFCDMELLEKRFGVDLPPQLRRSRAEPGAAADRLRE